MAKKDSAIDKDKVKKLKIEKAQKKDPALIEEEKRAKLELKSPKKQRKRSQEREKTLGSENKPVQPKGGRADLEEAVVESEEAGNAYAVGSERISVEPAPYVPLPGAGDRTAHKKKVVFLCTGNTCRSPMAEYIFKFVCKKYNRENEYDVSSAGISASGGNMSANAQFALQALNIPFENHTSTQMSVRIAKEADLIICMTKSHKDAMGGIQSCVTLSDLTGCGDIPDPFGQNRDAYLGTARILLSAIEALFA